MVIPQLSSEYEVFLIPHSGGDFSSQVPHQDKETGGCKSLIAAILLRAIEDLNHPNVKPHDKRHAAAWIRSNKVTQKHITFLFCCEVLGLSADNLRRRLLIRSNDLEGDKSRPQASRLCV